MSEEATIEDEPEVEQPTHSSRPETNTGLLKWSYIFEISKSFRFDFSRFISFANEFSDQTMGSIFISINSNRCFSLYE